jgi:aspartate/glutamate racemase
MHLRAEYQEIVSPIIYQDLTPGKLEEHTKALVEKLEASTKTLAGSGADSSQTTDRTNR